MEFDTLEAANRILHQIARDEAKIDLGYSKTSVTVTFEDGETFPLRIDVNKKTWHIGEEMLHIAKFSIEKPSHLSQKDYEDLLKYESNTKQQCIEFLTKYNIGLPQTVQNLLDRNKIQVPA